MGEAIKELHQEHGMSEEGLKEVPPSWEAWALEPPGENGRRLATVAELAAHDGGIHYTEEGPAQTGYKAVNKIQLE